MARRPAPPRLEGISGAELRRREEPRKKLPKAPMEYWRPTPDAARTEAEDRAGLPPGDVVCFVCGAWLRWTFQNATNDHALNRDGTDHSRTCQPRGTMTTAEITDVVIDAINRVFDKPPLVTIQSGPRNARTDPDSGLRFYRWQVRELPSVTSSRRMAGLPFGLHNWTVGQVINAAIDNASEIASRLRSGDAGTIQVIRHELRSAATAERDKAASLGTAVHDAAAGGLPVTAVPAEVAPRLRQYLDWLRVSSAEVLASEFQVFNLTVGYAGTVDLLARFPNGSLWIVDLKTGKGIYSDHALQVVAYAKAEFVGEDDVVNEDLTALLRQVAGTAVLHLSDSGWEFHVVRFDEETWRAFRGLLAFALWSHTHPAVGDFTTAMKEGRDAA